MSELFNIMPADENPRKPSTSPAVQDWYIERLVSLSPEILWEQLEHAGQLRTGDIYRIKSLSPLADMFREVTAGFEPIYRVVRDPVPSPQGWLLVTESTQISLFAHPAAQTKRS